MNGEMTITGRIIAVFVGAVLTLAALEGAARWAFPEWAPRSARLTNFWQYDEKLGWKHVPGAIGRFSYGFDTLLQINSHGFREPERDYVRDGDVLYLCTDVNALDDALGVADGGHGREALNGGEKSNLTGKVDKEPKGTSRKQVR